MQRTQWPPQLHGAPGAPIRDIQEWMGHAHISTTEQYAHYVPRRDDAARIAAAFRVDQPEGAASAV